MSDQWEKPDLLRQRPDANLIECQAVLSGRWKPLSDSYWNNCVIDVPWRLRKEFTRNELFRVDL